MTEIYQIELEHFTSPRDKVDFLKKPFNRAGKTVACNGHALVLFPEQPNYEELDAAKFTNFYRLLDDIEAAEFKPMTLQVEFPARFTCSVCNGKGKAVLIPCEECEGEGLLHFENDFNVYECTCQKCHGNGNIVELGKGCCYNCKGTGYRYESRQSIKVGNIYIDPNYLKLIINAPDLHLYEMPDKLLFKSGLIVGAIMKTSR
jgi:hypothetical protein